MSSAIARRLAQLERVETAQLAALAARFAAWFERHLRERDAADRAMLRAAGAPVDEGDAAVLAWFAARETPAERARDAAILAALVAAHQHPDDLPALRAALAAAAPHLGLRADAPSVVILRALEGTIGGERSSGLREEG